ncbi:3-oxoacyl-[acyl-carrier-protein] reductase FabG [Colletotrichum siamense]|uniref:3-oxoacyl-[acyl-carrier-protein] reductase FabG n=1 Tax=Colletotrichum siamense TaxID=690259 RepID=A0A9P5K5E9_COLSI|nr:3-oxoacyl-[acyl-carrier-protein] reductase FabG [Colletotrichum siamense]KAF4859657.1 3-oxoacyl-[acyl-carrier-protein] reductase FabG [Colletotrichum siamense]
MVQHTIQNTDNRTQGRLALVTGASGGIGSSVAHALAAEGCDVALHYSSSQGKAEALAQELRAKYPSQLFVPFQADLSSRESTRNLVPSIFASSEVTQKHKAISILVANAGLGRRIRDPADIGEDDWDEMMEVNARSQFVVTKACLPGMRAQGWGRVVLVGSIASRGGGINGCHYAATKAQWGSTWQRSWHQRESQSTLTWDSRDDLEALRATDPGLAIAASVPVHRLGAPEEVANVVTIDYGGNPGIPPCRRCVREQKECVLATSRRGGRRPRKCVRLPDSDSTGAAPFPPGTTSTFDSVPADGATSSEQPPGADQKSSETNRPWSCSPEAETPGRAASWPGSGSQPNSPGGRSLQSAGDIEGHITSSDLLNPSDALNLLAQVADLDGDGGTERNRKPSGSTTHEDGTPRDHPSSKTLATYHYPPISDGVLSLSVASRLLATYYEHYHPFFPVAHNCILSPPSIPFLTDSEPHLVTAIFTVVSKDEPSLSAVHEACSRHMETLISKLIYKGSTTVGAVEALLILAQWAPQRLQEKPTVGRGEEDEGAWMQIGVAIRLGYLQSLEQTGLLVDKQSALSEQFRRKRLVWAACYMSDREVSIRVGKGFWSRGPGPSTIPRSADFPSLRVQQAGPDNLGQLFQAQLELIQLFSNAHDILYSSAGHRAQLYLGGEYVRYIDDSFAVLRKWKLVWGSLSFTPLIKAALNLSYEFLRLYINAFAFQATINRAITRARQQQQQLQQQSQTTAASASSSQPQQQQPPQQQPPQPQPTSATTARTTTAINTPLFGDLASTPDARFIYESMDAANSLLNILNTSVDPVTGLRYMPLKYYLYVIYAAVFLFKARLAGALGAEASDSVRRSISVTITCLQRSSISPHSLGHRYASLLSLLWRSKSASSSTSPKATTSTAAAAAGNHPSQTTPTASSSSRPGHHPSSSHTAPSHHHTATSILPSTEHTNPSPSYHDPHPSMLLGHDHASGMHHTGAGGMGMTPLPLSQTELLCRGFSWRDLDDLGQFIGPPADMAFADPTGLHVVGNISLDEGAAYDVLWPGNDVVF